MIYVNINIVLNDLIENIKKYSYPTDITDIEKMSEEKFVENFLIRFSRNADKSNTYEVEIYDVNETPPKVSLRVRSGKSTTATGEEFTFNIDNHIDAILETKY